MDEEYGCIEPVNIANPTFYESDSCEIVNPSCEKCGNYKQCIIGPQAYKWICFECGE